MPESKLKSIGQVRNIPHNQPMNVPLTDYSNKYDENYRPEYNQEFNRADNQSWHQQLGYGLISRSLSILPKLGSGVGSIYGLGKTVATGEEAAIWDNSIVKWMNELDEGIKEQLPVYQSLKNAESGLVGKLATTSFWANDAFDGIAYALSAFVPGTAIGKATQAGSGVLKSTKIGSRLVEGLKKIGLDSQRTTLLGSTVYNTISESAVEAYQTQQEIQQLLLAKGMNPEEAKLKASEAASRTFRSNLAVLAVPNFIQSTMFHGAWDDVQKSVRSAVWANDGKITAELAKTESIWNKIAKGVASEGLWEENVQTSLSQYERVAAKSGNYDLDYSTEVAANVGKNILGFLGSFGSAEQTPEEIEGAVSIFLGGLIGGASAFKEASNDKKQFENFKTSEEQRYSDLITKIGPAATGLLRDNINSIHQVKGKKTVKVDNRDVEVDDYVLDDNGNAVVDPEKIKNLTLNQLANKHFWDADMIAAYRNDPALAELNRQTALVSYAYALATSKNEYSPEEIGVIVDRLPSESDNITLKDGKESIKEYIKHYRQLRDKIGSAKDDSINPERSNFNQFLIKSNLYLTAKLNSLNKVLPIATTESGKNTISTLISDTRESLLQLSEQVSAIEKAYAANIVQPTKLALEYTQLKNKTNKTEEELNRQRELYYLLSESQFIEGNPIANIPISSDTKDLTRSPGVRNLYNNELGVTALGISKLEEAIVDDKVPVEDLVKIFAQEITAVNRQNYSEVSRISDRISDKLDSAKTELEKSRDTFLIVSQFLTELISEDALSENVELVTLLSEVSNIGVGETVEDLVQNPEINYLLQSMAAEGIHIGGTDIYTQEWLDLNIQSITKLLSKTNKIIIELDRQIEAGDIMKQYSSADERINPNLARSHKDLREYASTVDKNEYLKKLYYGKKIEVPTDTYIRRFNDNPESFIDESEYGAILENLQAAKVAFIGIKSTSDQIDYFINYLSTKIYPTILKNHTNRAQFHKNTSDRIIEPLAHLFAIPEIRKLFQNVLGDRFDEISDLSYDAVKTTWHYFKIKSNEEQKNKLRNLLLLNRSSVSNKLLDSLPNVLNKSAVNLKRTKGFEERVTFNFNFLLSQYFQDNEIITKFLNDYNLDSLLLSLKSGKFNNEEYMFLQNVIEAYSNINAINDVISHLDSNLDYIQFLRLKKEEFIDQIPSLQQNIALTEGMQFLNKPLSKDNFANWLIVRGIGGSGKTYFMAKALLELNKKLGNPTNVFAFSREDLTSQNINNSIGGDRTNTFEKFLNLNESDLALIDILVLDEVYTFSNLEIAAIREKIAQSSKTIKVIALGDPSQLSVEINPDFIGGLYTNFSLPLTTSYRTNVSAISSYIEKFQLSNLELKGVLAQANMSKDQMLSDLGNANGVHIANQSDFDEIVNSASKRTRVLITNDPQIKRSYSGIPGLAVKLVSESHGYQWDEVYVNINEALLPQDNFEINRILYTAYSRSKQLLVIVGESSANVQPNPELSSAINNSDNDLLISAQLYKENVAAADRTKEILDGKASFSRSEVTEIDVVDENEPAVLPATVENPSYLEVEPDSILSGKSEGLSLNFPTNYSLTPKISSIGQQIYDVLPNADAHVIRINSNGVVGYELLVDSAINPGNFVSVGRLTEQDFLGEYGEALNNIISSSDKKVDAALIAKGGYTPISNIDSISLGKLKILGYTKFGTKSSSFTDARELLPGAKDVFDDTIIRFVQSYFKGNVKQSTPWVSFENDQYTVNWKAIGNDVKLVIPTRKDVKDGRFGWDSKTMNRRGLSVKYGVPYLLVKPNILNSPTPESILPILIPMQPTRLHKSEVNLIRILYDNVKIIEELTGVILGTKEFADTIREYVKDNFKISDDNTEMLLKSDIIPIEEYFELPKDAETIIIESAVQQIARLIFKPELKTLYFKTEEEALTYIEDNGTQHDVHTSDSVINGKLIVGVAKTKDKRNLWTIQYSTDPANRDDSSPLRIYSLREGGGSAQVILNSLAQANNTITESFLQLRKESVSLQGKRSVKTFKTHSILGNFETDEEGGKRSDREYVDYRSFYQDPEVVRLVGNNSFNVYTDLLDALEVGYTRDGLSRADARSKGYELISRYQAEHITSELLDLISGDSSFDETDRHNINGTSLRTPLRLHTSNSTGIHDLGNRLEDSSVRNILSSMIRTNFDEVVQTNVWYEPIGNIKKAELKSKVTNVAEFFKLLSPFNDDLLDNLVEVVKKLPINNVEVTYSPNGIPVYENGNLIFKQNVFATGVDNNGQTIIQTTIDLKNILKDRDLSLKFLHEILHSLTIPTLTKGQSDARRKINSAEAQFYKTLVTIKRRFDNAIKSKINPETSQRYRTSEVYEKTPSKLDVFEFVANLSNPKFIKLAKEINVLPKATKSKSIFRELLEAIVKYLSKFLGNNPNVYDATLNVLEQFYSKVESTNTSVSTIVQTIDPINLERKFLADISNALKVPDEFSFEDAINYITENLFHVIDLSTLPRRFGDTQYDLEFTETYRSLTDIDKVTILSNITLDNLQFAYISLPKQVTTLTAGGINTTRNLTTFIDKVFTQELTDVERNLLRSIILFGTSDYSRRLDIILGDDIDKSNEIIFNNVLSQNDKSYLSSLLNVRFENLRQNLFSNDSTVGDSIHKVVNILKSQRNDVDFIITSVEDRGGLRYEVAKKFILKILRDNLNKNKGLIDSDNPESLVNLIKDRREIRNEIKNLIKSSNILLPSGLTIRESTRRLNDLYTELTELRNNPNITQAQMRKVNQIINVDIPTIEDEIVGISALRDKDDITGVNILDKIFTDIYPKFILRDEEDLALAQEINELTEAGYINKDNVDNELEAVANISEYIKKYDKSYELTLSESLKDYLLHVTVGNTAISSGLVYIKTLQLAVAIDWTQNLTDPTRGIIAQINSILNAQSNLSTLDRAIISNLRDTILLATSTSYLDGVDLSGEVIRGITSYNNSKGTTYYVAYKSSIPNSINLTYDELKMLKRAGEDVEFSNPSISTEPLYQWLNDIDILTFNRLFSRAEAINSIRGIMNTMASMKETELYGANRTHHNGSVFMMQRSKASGVAFSIKDTIEYSLFKLYESNKLRQLTDIFTKRSFNGKSMLQLESGTPEEKVFYVREFFTLLGFSSVSEQIVLNPIEANDWIEQIGGFLNLTKESPVYSVTEELENEGDEFNDWIDGNSVNEVSGYITRFSDLISRSSDILRNPSVRDINGNKSYKFHESSWAYDVVLNLNQLNKDNVVYRGSTGASVLRSVPDYLRSSYFNHNIFVRNNTYKLQNKIYSIGEYEGAKNLDNDSVTPYTRENMFYFYHRLFVQGFLDGIRQYKNSYYQFTYIPSDKPKHPMLRLGLLSDGENSQILKGIETALAQILEIKKYGSKVEVANYQLSVEKDLFRTFKLGEVAIKELNIDFTSENIPRIALKVSELMTREASNLLDELLSNDVRLTFDKKTYHYIHKLSNKFNQTFKINDTLGRNPAGEIIQFKSGGRENYNVSKEEILPLFDLFFKNNYVNGYFANQIIAGDYMAYKRASDDIIKRYAGVFAPGIKGLVDPTLGMKPTYKVFVLEDTVEFTGANKNDFDNLSDKSSSTRGKLLQLFYNGEEPVDEELKRFEDLMAFFADKFESTDAQGFILPKRKIELTRGFERSWGLGQVHKPVHFEIKKYSVVEDRVEVFSTAIPYYTKYSAIDLDDSIVERYPLLGKLRTFGEKMGVDEILFKSAVKEGMPVVRNENGELSKSFTFADIMRIADDDIEIAKIKRFVNTPILELSNSNYRLQHNPQADPTKGVSLFTQIIYFLNVYADKLSGGDYATTQDAAQEVYTLIGELISLGRNKFKEEIGNDEASVIKFLKKSLSGPGAERALELVQNGISINHPLLEKRGIISIASGMEKATVKIKLPGGKLVLQSAEGSKSSGVETDLQYRFEDLNGKRILVADAIVPESLLTRDQRLALSRGESIYTLPDLLGFRIPSTELHSAVALRIVKTYNDKSTNVIIVPKEIVAIHGSDQ